MRPKAKGSQVYNSQKVRITLDLTVEDEQRSVGTVASVVIDAVIDNTSLLRIDAVEAFEIPEAGEVPA